MTQFYDAALRATGLRSTQFTLLQTLGQAGTIRQADLAEILAMDSTTLSRTLKLLEDESWIKDCPGGDRRERRFRLTPRGKGRLRRAKGQWKIAQARLRGAIGSSGWKKLLGALDRATRTARQIST